ncbi:glycosyltransferase family 2 protein [Mucilaginibacter sp. UYCu711]|uniref:glycosyltransferase family 2 protein n=1 Tax=Mucilaginibacter sp. UYCu711 TaxID=3156339 RepID=UPI003D23147F
MNSLPLISVIIPTYNRALRVVNAIESVLNQTYKNVQLIVVDDGSEDGTSLALQKFPTINYIKVPHGGQALARNQGLLLAEGSYIATLDSDDVWENNFLEICLKMLEECQLDFVFANWMQNSKDGTSVNWFSVCEVLKSTLKESSEEWIMLKNESLRSLYLTGCPSPSSSLLLRRASIKSVWESSLCIADDWCLLLDMIFKGKCKAAVTKQVLWAKNIDGQNIYDGNNYVDVLRDLWVHDIDILFQRFKAVFTAKETRTFKKEQAMLLMQYSLYILKVNKEYRTSFVMAKKAFKIVPFIAFKFLFNRLSIFNYK